MKRETKVDKSNFKTYRKLGTKSFRLYNGAIIKPNQVFSCDPAQIPKTFMDLVVEIDGSESKVKKVKKVKEPVKEKEEVEETQANENPAFILQDMGDSWFHILNVETQKVVTEKKLRKAKAEALLAELLA